MAEQHDRHPLPEVTSDDLLHIEVQKILDPTSHERWMRVASENKLLARAIDAEAKALYMAHIERTGREALQEIDIIQLAIQIGTFAVQALANAFEREIDDFNNPRTSSDDGDGDPQPSDEPLPGS